jgi:hypothetical protein
MAAVNACRAASNRFLLFQRLSVSLPTEAHTILIAAAVSAMPQASSGAQVITKARVSKQTQVPI